MRTGERGTAEEDDLVGGVLAQHSQQMGDSVVALYLRFGDSELTGDGVQFGVAQFIGCPPSILWLERAPRVTAGALRVL
jgi:hypothetical protein